MRGAVRAAHCLRPEPARQQLDIIRLMQRPHTPHNGDVTPESRRSVLRAGLRLVGSWKGVVCVCVCWPVLGV